MSSVNLCNSAKKERPAHADLSLGEDKVFLYLSSHYRSAGGIMCFGIVVVYPHSLHLYKKSFEKYLYMSYTMDVIGICASDMGDIPVRAAQLYYGYNRYMCRH